MCKPDSLIQTLINISHSSNWLWKLVKITNIYEGKEDTVGECNCRPIPMLSYEPKNLRNKLIFDYYTIYSIGVGIGWMQPKEYSNTIS